ncbi:probable WRKY transcription factor 58 isoform X2 [Mangifera indica]|uniref:probable WRKY transcription factor 58 isoform X2 n=1 Tax=Mangifera indica TaxID=29780 RepID=UPI001CFAEF5D|nr:probable WRKY transcription factor 58 isoform X2 [Mangifera indica]
MSNNEANSPFVEDQNEGQRGNIRLDLPEDGYEWKKYGQKFIKGIGKFRSYFKCQKANCMAKKRADWSPSEPGSVRIAYENEHSHGSNNTTGAAGSSQSSNNANQYNLLTQFLEDQPTNSQRPESQSN